MNPEHRGNRPAAASPRDPCAPARPSPVVRARMSPVGAAIAVALLLTTLPSHLVAQSAQAERDAERAERVRRAEQLLEELRRRRPEPEVIPPASSAGRVASAPRPVLYPEGTTIIDRVGTIRQAGDGWVAEFEPVPQRSDASPTTMVAPTVSRLKLLPNSILDAMTRMVQTAPHPLSFVISGELTVFQDENYLLPRAAMRAPPLYPPPKTDADPAADSPDGDSSQVPPDDQPIAWDAADEDVLARMRKLDTQMPAILRGDPEQTEKHRPQRFAAPPMLEGFSLAARTGRLVREGPGWTFAFDSARPDQPDASFRLLPNRSLEFMVAAAQNEASGLTFVASGEVTAFQGQNYLLVRTVTRPLETGNLRR